MKLKEALEEVRNELPLYSTMPETNFMRAIALLYEAGKVLVHGRKIGQHVDPALLPGETED